MIVLWALLGIGLSLGAQLALGSIAPAATRYVDLMMLPLAAYALRTSQRSSMTVGCVSGLLQDYWTEPRLLGINGLIKTILGWALGGLGARFDLNNFAGRLAAGASINLLDEGLQAGIRRLFGESLAPVHPVTLAVRALAGGLLTAFVLAIVGKMGRARSAARPARRKA
ncbi:MAG TPA: rod shape-determining protein MreD [Candidatus Polarisedimenticolaceae bacterium]|nr:rod shape-determining protein MreD [Candidatus Polarisedimenticolaceae bacterium]